MKVKAPFKKAVSLMLSLVMIFTFMSVGFTAGAVACDHPNIKSSSVSWEILREPTCSVTGIKEARCPDCKELVKYSIDVDPNAHVMGPWETVRVSSCTQEGLEVRYCAYGCKDSSGNLIVFDQRAIPMHNYKVLYGEAATCLQEGYEFVMCDSCLDVTSRTLPIDPTAHTYSEWVINTNKEATCVLESGERRRFCINTDGNGHQCTVVEKESYTDPDNHKNVEWREDEKVESTCQERGYIPGTCTDCNREVYQYIPQHTQANHSTIRILKNATCISEGIERRRCDGCGLEYEVAIPVDMNNHIEGDWIVAKEPGCTDGLRYKSCIYHTESRTEQTIPATGEHNYGEWVVEIEADCSQTGLKVKRCTAEGCDAVITQELPTKHNFFYWDEEAEVKMDCNEEHLVIGTKLARCVDCNFEKYFTVPTLHDYSLWSISKKSDCKTGSEGTMVRVCAKCGKEETKSYVAEHDFGEWYITSYPVCATADKSGKTGVYTRQCNTCKTKEEKTIPATHVWGEWEVESYPYCSADGTTVSGKSTAHCIFCGVETEVETFVEHKFGEWTVTKAATCKEEGSREHTCIICNYTQSESIAKNHVFSEWKGVECGKADNGMYRECTVEGCNIRETKTGTYTHPNLKSTVIEPTCTSNGYTINYCPDCKSTTYTDIVDANGHELDAEWTNIGLATCTTEGSRYKACANCDYLEYEKYARANHVLIELVAAKAPTCTQAGHSAESYCSVCREVFESQELPATGHQFEADSEVCKVCKVYKDSNECTCSCHSNSGMEKIIFSIICKLYQMIGINQYCKCGIMHYEEVGLLAQLLGKG